MFQEGHLPCWVKDTVGGFLFLCRVASGSTRKELLTSRKPVLRESLSTLQFPPEASPVTIGRCSFKSSHSSRHLGCGGVRWREADRLTPAIREDGPGWKSRSQALLSPSLSQRVLGGKPSHPRRNTRWLRGLTKTALWLCGRTPPPWTPVQPTPVGCQGYHGQRHWLGHCWRWPRWEATCW